VKYMLLMNVPYEDGCFRSRSWKPEEFRAHMDHMHALNRDLIRSGEFVTVQGLAAPGEARVVRAGSNGLPAVTDGPFPETKEFLAGYWIVDVESADRACEIAGRASAAPGPGGVPLELPIQVRQVTDIPVPDA
jgi:hypothetical protein